MGRSACALALLLAGLYAPALAADRATAERVLHMIYNTGLYDSEIDRIMVEADRKSVFGAPAPRHRREPKTGR